MPLTPARRLALAGAAFGMLALAGCIPPAPEPTPMPQPSPTPVATPVPTPTPAPVPTSASWMDAPVTQGDWSYRQSGTQQLAEFRSPAGATAVTLACASRQQVVLTLPGTSAAVDRVTIRTESIDRSIAASGNATAVVAAIGRYDSLLDAMAFSRGRFAIAVPGAPTLYLPAYPEITRVVEECRG